MKERGWSRAGRYCREDAGNSAATIKMGTGQNTLTWESSSGQRIGLATSICMDLLGRIIEVQEANENLFAYMLI